MEIKNALAKTRTKLGWTQPEMASYLKVGVSLLSMAELGQRELPMPAYLQLMELAASLPDGSESVAMLSPDWQENKELERQLEKRIQNRTWKLKQLQNEYAGLTAKLQNITNRKSANQCALEKIAPNDPRRQWKIDFLRNQAARLRTQSLTELQVQIIVTKSVLKAVELELNLLSCRL